MLSDERIQALQNKAEAMGPDLEQLTEEESFIDAGPEHFVPVVDEEKSEIEEPKRQILEDPGVVLIADQPEDMASDDIDNEVEVEMHEPPDELPDKASDDEQQGAPVPATDEEEDDHYLGLYSNLPDDIEQQIVGPIPQTNENRSRGFAFRLAGYRQKRLRSSLCDLDRSMEQYKQCVAEVVNGDLTSPRSKELGERLEKQAKMVMRCANQCAHAGSGVGNPQPVLRSVDEFMKTQTNRMKSAAASQDEEQKKLLDQLIERIQKIIGERLMRIVQAFKKAPNKQSTKPKP